MADTEQVEQIGEQIVEQISDTAASLPDVQADQTSFSFSGIDQFLSDNFDPIAKKVESIVFYEFDLFPGMFEETVKIKLILIWLVLAGLFFTFSMRFMNVRYFSHAFNILRGKYDTDGNDGEINRFQALATSLSGTVGLGNIAGVAIAVSAGGPGAVVWMIVMGFFSMMTKFTEVMLGVKYRKQYEYKGVVHYSGGPMYYLRAIFANRNIPFVGQFMASLFAVLCILGMIGAGPLFQTNQAYQQFVLVTGGDESFLADKGWLFGLVMAGLVGIVIIGGIKSIASAASKIVPLMGIVYMAAAFIVIAIHFHNIPTAFTEIFKGAFNLKAGFGAFLGVMLVGVQRATFSNEAGFGTAAIAHSSVKTNDPVTQGFVGMLGPFIDTVLVCTTTALVIVISGEYLNGAPAQGFAEGVELTSRAFQSGISWFPYVLTLTVFLFAYSTMLAWSYYGEKAFTFLVGDNKYTTLIYKIFLLFFIVVGAAASLSSVVAFTDSMVFAMTIPNLIGLYFVSGEVRRDVKEYLQKLKSA